MRNKAYRRYKRVRPWKDIVLNALILLISIGALLPLFWILVTACKSQIEILKEPLKIIPEVNMFWSNFQEVWSRGDWVLYYKNTIILTFMIWAVQMLVAIPAGYAFAVLKMPGKNFLFLVVLMRLMISPESTMLANYLTVLKLDAYDTRVGIMLPYIVSAQAIFMFRQAFKQLPMSLMESAKIDGCGDFRYMLHIGLPLIKPYLMSFSIITCVFQWNAFFWPMLITKSPDKRILPVAMTFFGLQAESGSEWGLTMVAALIVIAPLLIIFIVCQKKFINSFVTSGIK